MGKKFIKPEILVIEFEIDDIILTSGGNDPEDGVGEGGIDQIP